MVYEVSETETLLRYIVYHDPDTEFVFRVMVQPIGVEVCISAIQEEHLDNICTTFRVLYATSTDV